MTIPGHEITVRPVSTNTFDVLINGHSYRIHRGLDEQQARQRAHEIRSEFRRIGQRAYIKIPATHQGEA